MLDGFFGMGARVWRRIDANGDGRAAPPAWRIGVTSKFPRAKMRPAMCADLLAVGQDVGGVIDAVEFQPETTIGIVRRDVDFSAIPI